MENKTASNYNDLPLKAPKLKGILLILFLVLLDQGTKYLAIRYLKGTSGISLIDNVLNLRYLENRGMAFGLLQNKILFLVLTCIVFFVAQVNPEDTGTRLDAWLAGQLPDVTRSAAARLCEEGRVTAAGKPLAKNYRLGGGEAVSVTLPDPEPVDVAPQDIPLDVVYEDSDVIVVNKPKGLVVHPAPGHPDGTLVNALLHHCGDSLSGIGGELRPGIVHRIDRDTSGLIIAAKNDAAHQKLSAQLQDHTLARIYRCIVIGNLREDSGTVDAPIGRHPADRKKMAVVAGGRSAVTHWSVLERFPGYTYVECRLETGRTHQIRVHMAHIGHPILGDTVYGAKKPVPGLQGQCLHAVGLRFLHPRTGELVELWCDLPEAFQTQLRKLENRG